MPFNCRNCKAGASADLLSLLRRGIHVVRVKARPHSYVSLDVFQTSLVLLRSPRKKLYLRRGGVFSVLVEFLLGFAMFFFLHDRLLFVHFFISIRILVRISLRSSLINNKRTVFRFLMFTFGRHNESFLRLCQFFCVCIRCYT